MAGIGRGSRAGGYSPLASLLQALNGVRHLMTSRVQTTAEEV